MDIFPSDPVILLSYAPISGDIIQDQNVNFKLEAGTNSDLSPCKDAIPHKSFFIINKPLVPLKCALFLWFGAALAVQIFLMVYFKSLGLTISQLSVINIINPIFQFFGPSISGMIADKIGKSKPVMFANFVVILIVANCILLIPKISTQIIDWKSLNVTCKYDDTIPIDEILINSTEVDSQFKNCTLHCQSNITYQSISSLCMSEKYFQCNIHLQSNSQLENLTLNCDIYHSRAVAYPEYLSTGESLSCSTECIQTKYKNNDSDKEVTVLFVLSLVLLTLFNLSLTNIFRFMDLTAMSMVKAHNSDFGRERFWSILSLLIFPPLAAFLVDATADGSGKRNFAAPFYLFDVLAVMSMIAVWKLDVEVNPPGKNMWKKAFGLLKDIDVLCFILAIVVLGTAWGFKKIFTSLYLEELNAPSILFSLITSCSGLVGLPFLVTSNWWINKIGSTNLLIFAFLAYTVDCIGYSFLVNPWWCLLCETMNIFQIHLLWVAVIRYTHQISPEGLTATVISTAGGIHFALGRSFGSLIGGMIMSEYGGRWAFRVMAVICAVTALFYGTFLFYRQRYKTNENSNKFSNKNTITEKANNAQSETCDISDKSSRH